MEQPELESDGLSVALEFPSEWNLRAGQILDTRAAIERLDYCLEWRPWLWHRPAAELLCPFERLQGKRVMEFGCGNGRMSCLLAAAGAQVVGVETNMYATRRAQAESAAWGLEGRVRFETYDGVPAHLPEGDFDVIFSKSALVMVRKVFLKGVLVELQSRLTPGGVGLFLENGNNRLLHALRRHVFHRRDLGIGTPNWGFCPDQIETIGRVFGGVEARKYLNLVWIIRAGRGVRAGAGPGRGPYSGDRGDQASGRPATTIFIQATILSSIAVKTSSLLRPARAGTWKE